MGNNGIHTLYPLGQDYTASYSTFMPYENFVGRVFAYVLSVGGNYEWSVYTSASGAYAIMKFRGRGLPYAVLGPASGRSYTSERNIQHNTGDFFSFAIRTTTDGTYGPSYATLYNEDSLNAVAFSWNGPYFANFNGGRMMQLSTHFCDNDPSAQFPVNEGLHNNLEAFVRFDLGTYLLYTGIYQGNGPIRIYRPRGAVPDLKNPSQTGIIVRIGIRINLESFVFTTDYGSTPVVAAFRDLIQNGYNFIPRFEMNFNVRHVLIESSKYTM